MRRRQRLDRRPGLRLAVPLEQLESRQLLAAQVYEGALSGKIVYTSGGHGWQWNTTLNRYATDRGDNQEIVEDFGNQDQLSFFADYILRAGGTVVPMRPVGNQTNEVVLDNDSAGVTFTGGWTNSANAHRYDEDYGAAADAVAYRFASTTSGAETSVATYQPNIPAAGFYPVYTWALDSGNRTTQLYRINHTGGTTEVRVDHRLVGKGWVYLGTYHFNAGSNATGNVQISNNSPVAGNVIADAIRFGNGMGDFVWTDSGAPGISGAPREDENSYHWIARAVGTGVSIDTATNFATNVSAPSNFAEWMNAAPFGQSVYIGFHSNAGGGRGARGLIDSDQGTPNQANLALFTGRQINADMQALDGVFEHDWIDGVSHTFSGGFGEIDLGSNAEFDATIIETAFHDSPEDAQLMRDPKVRDQLARSTYEAVIEYFRSLDANQVTTRAPEVPTNVRAIAAANGDITLTWSAPPTRANGPQAASGYRVYTSRNGYGFSDPVVTSGTSLTIPSAQLDGNAYYFKVTGTNAGGEGPGSVVVGARKNGAGGGGGTNRVLIVNGFDRNERSQNQRYPYAFDAQADNLTDRVRLRYNNSFDYVVQAGEAVEAYLSANGVSLGFDSVQNEQVANNTVPLTNYQTVIWLGGEESTVNETFSSTEQTRISTFLAGGGRLFVSGAEIGWDLEGQTGETPEDVVFYNATLRADYAADDGGSNQVGGVAGSIFAGLSGINFDNGTNGFYNVDTPDRINAINGSTVAMNYTGAGGSGGAAVQWAQNAGAGAGGARLVNMGFPFEMINSAANRNTVMARVLNFFETAVSTTPGAPDLLAATDTGASSTDNLTNRDNAAAGRTLQFSVSGTVAGATVLLYSGATLIGSAVASGTTTTVTTNGTADLPDGVRSITARQLEPGKTESTNSTALSVTVDTVGPTGDLVDVTPDPRQTPVDSVTFVFSEAVTGFDVGDMLLLRNPGVVVLPLGPEHAPASSDGGITYTVSNLAALTNVAGEYNLGIDPPSTGIADLAGNTLPGTGIGDTWVLEAANVAPVVTNVFVAGSTWNTAYRNLLQSSGDGEAAFGYRVPAGTTQHRSLAWSNLNQVSVRFSEDVVVASDDLVVNGVNVASYGVNAFAYDPVTFTATWTLAQAIPNDKVTITLDADAGTGVADTAGAALDGEWTNPTGAPPTGGDAFPSGDANAGGDFAFSFRVLPGDLDGNNAVNIFDFNILKPKLNQVGQGVVNGDINGDNVVNIFDFNDLKTNLGKVTPA